MIESFLNNISLKLYRLNSEIEDKAFYWKLEKIPEDYDEFKSKYLPVVDANLIEELNQNLSGDFENLYNKVISFSQVNFMNSLFTKLTPVIISRKRLLKNNSYIEEAQSINVPSCFDEYQEELIKKILLKKEGIPNLNNEYSFLKYLRDVVENIGSFKFLLISMNLGNSLEEQMIIKFNEHYICIINALNEKLNQNYKRVFQNVFNQYIKVIAAELMIDWVGVKKLILTLLWWIFNKYINSYIYQNITNKEKYLITRAMNIFNELDIASKVKVVSLLNNFFTILIKFDERELQIQNQTQIETVKTETFTVKKEKTPKKKIPKSQGSKQNENVRLGIINNLTNINAKKEQNE